MEYFSNFSDKPTTIQEDLYQWFDLSENPRLLFGNPYFSITQTFDKYPYIIDEEIQNLPRETLRKSTNVSFKEHRYSSSGCMIRFKTSAKQIVLKAELKRKWDFQVMNLYNSSGFDIYSYNPNTQTYQHITVTAPKSGQNCFLETICIFTNCETVIFLPTYNKIINLKIGIPQSETLEFVDEFSNYLPIAFYGNSITQGAGASRSGNIFCNIVSRQLNTEVYNYSISGGALGFRSIAKELAKLNLSAIVMDYSRNADRPDFLEKTYCDFYRILRKSHPNIPIILLTCSNFSCLQGYIPFDNVIRQVHQQALKDHENTYLLNQMDLFEQSEYDLCCVDSSHYNDYATFKIASEITRILLSDFQKHTVKFNPHLLQSKKYTAKKQRKRK